MVRTIRFVSVNFTSLTVLLRGKTPFITVFDRTMYTISQVYYLGAAGWFRQRRTPVSASVNRTASCDENRQVSGLYLNLTDFLSRGPRPQVRSWAGTFRHVQHLNDGKIFVMN